MRPSTPPSFFGPPKRSRLLTSNAVPLFVRIVDDFEQTSTFKNRKVELRKEGYTDAEAERLYVLLGKEKGYTEFYDDYPDDVAAAKVPKG